MQASDASCTGRQLPAASQLTALRVAFQRREGERRAPFLTPGNLSSEVEKHI